MVVFITIMNISAEAIAGDKERGFLNTVLVTPVSRGSIATGKAVSIYILAVIGGLSTFGGMIVSLPKMAKATDLNVKIVYTFSDYALLFAVTVNIVFCILATAFVAYCFKNEKIVNG